MKEPPRQSSSGATGLGARAPAAPRGEPVPGAAHARGVRSFYRDLGASPGEARVCIGTACALAHARGEKAPLPAAAARREVHCLGHCDRGPAALTADGSLVLPPGRAARPSLRAMTREPIVLARLLAGDHAELARARAAGVYGALASAVAAPDPAAAVLSEIERSGERGRGGAGFPTGAKWRACAEAARGRGVAPIVIANGDEGDPGSFIDRILLEEDPHAVLEGLALCALAVGAREAIVFVRSEYPRARARVEAALAQAREAGLLGDTKPGRLLPLDVRVVSGHGSYVCGEETALLRAIEGERGEASPRPPYPTAHGLHGRPTVVQNVETLVNAPFIVARGAAAYRAHGTAASPGTKVICLSGDFARPGAVEIELGTSLGAVVDEAGSADGLRMIAVGGPMGSLVTPDAFDVALCEEPLRARGIALGHGGLVAIRADADLRSFLLRSLVFFADESCGRCMPCSLGSRRLLAQAQAGLAPGADRDAFRRLLDTIAQTSLCAFGERVPVPLRELLALAGDDLLAAKPAP